MEQGRKRTAALHNLGCKVNAYETEAMRQMLEEAGYEIVPFAPGADVYVINTCSVTNMADRKSRQMLHRARKFNPKAAVAAVGCYVQTAQDKTHLPVEADIILGTNHRQDLVPALEAFFAGRSGGENEAAAGINGPAFRVSDIARGCEYEPLRLERTTEHTRAFIKVQDGCNQFCSYCIIPYARGRVRSRQAFDVVRELEALAREGIREVVLTGIHISSYGTDLPADPEGKRPDLLQLIRAAARVEGIDRIRLGSLEPGIITEEFARELSKIDKICPHFHLSLQSGCDTVLRRMNRHYTAAEYEQRCKILRTWFDDPALTTDVIVGFPGETEEEFEETVGFLKQIRFYETHIFKYSVREGTRAAAMDGQVSEEIKTRRSARLLALGEAFRADYEKRREGKACEALFEEKVSEGGMDCFAGHTREYIRVLIPAREDFSNRIIKGTYRMTDPGQGGVLPVFFPI